MEHLTEPVGLSLPYQSLEPRYEVVIVGSGYGASIAASRLARAGRRVCVLERGKEYFPHDFPNEPARATCEMQVDAADELGHLVRKNPLGLFDFRLNRDVNVLIGCGLGGTSLINANVSIQPDERVFLDPAWPEELRKDAAGLKDGYLRAQEMLRPRPYPAESPGFPRLAKSEALERGSAKVGAPFRYMDINVNFEYEGPNHVGTLQRKCVNCGDCCSGCRYRSKNTLATNYLPDARNHGAHLFTQIRVERVEKKPDGRYLVHYFHQPGLPLPPDAKPSFVEAEIVILGAGALGSTEILLRSGQAGLSLSKTLGSRFSGNGDVLAFSYNADRPCRSVGAGDGPVPPVPPVGPCITGVLDTRRSDRPLEEGMVLEDGVIPGLLAKVLPEGFAAAALGEEADPKGNILKDAEREAESLTGNTKEGAIVNTLTYLVMSHDGAAGRLGLNGARLEVDWPGYANLEGFKRVEENLRKASNAIQGTFIENPITEKAFGKHMISVHPLGGSPMGSDRDRGVVDHRCEVFDGQAASPGGTHRGLYVCDGSVIPRSLGVNPLYTISAVAERACAILARERHWSIPYNLPVAPGVTPPKAQVPDRAPIGFTFTEIMRGFGSKDPKALGDPEAAGALGQQEGAGSILEFCLTITVDDLEAFLANKEHPASLTGTVTCPLLGDGPLSVSRGRFNLFTQPPQAPNERRMYYEMVLSSAQGKRYFFHGEKRVGDDPAFEVWRDTTKLFVTVREGEDKNGPVVLAGIQRIHIADFLRQLESMSAVRAQTPLESLEAKGNFARFFMGQLWQVYEGERIREIPLYTLEGVPHAKALHYPFSTGDKLGLSLERFLKAPCDDVVLVIHGLTTSTDMFIMPEHRNLVGYLLAKGFTDVWCLDFRMSNRHSYNLFPHRFTMDDIALFDMPGAVREMRRHVGKRRIHVICHCLGSASFTMSLFGKAVTGIRSVIANSVALTPRVPAWSFVKLSLGPFFVETLLGFPYLNPRWSEEPGLTRGKIVSKLVDLFHWECDVPACHMLSLMWGTGWPALYSHDNLLPVTHRRGGDLYGATSLNYYRHVRKMVAAGNRAVKYDPKNPIYGSLPDDYLAYAKEIQTPVLFMTGRKNNVFRDSNILCHQTLEKIVPGRHELAIFEGYGHQDVFMGKSVAQDVFPRLLQFLEKHRK